MFVALKGRGLGGQHLPVAPRWGAENGADQHPGLMSATPSGSGLVAKNAARKSRTTSKAGGKHARPDPMTGLD